MKLSVRNCLWACVILAVSFYIGQSTVHPGNIRTMLGYGLMLLVVGLSIGKPQTATYLITIYLPLMGLIRRILIPIAGWGSFDPLVLLGSVTSLLLGSYWFYRRFFLQEHPLNDSYIFKLVRWMILIDIVEVVNPRQGSPFVGLGGILFYVVPLFWMVASRNFMTERWMKSILYTTFIVGILAAVYGLKQTFYGFYPFELQWLNIVGLKITSLHIGGKIRALGTTDNPQEYAAYLQIGMLVGWMLILEGRWGKKLIGLLGSGVIGYALFMESVRGALLSTPIAFGVLAVLHARTPRKRIAVLIIATTVVVVGSRYLSHISANNYTLVGHSIGGLADPFGTNSSLGGHTATMWSGVWRGIKSVIGYGLGSTTTAAGKFSSAGSGTEMDISNMFVSDGIVGGAVYIALIASIFFRAFGLAWKGSWFGRVCLGLLISTVGQWGNGELYSSATIVWITVGYLDRISLSNSVTTLKHC